MNWYAMKRNSDNVVVSIVSDDSSGFQLVVPGFTLVGPYVSQAAAIFANITTVNPQQQAITTLLAKPAATWTLADLATWLQNKG